MLHIDTILYPTDFSTSAEVALPYALDLARRHNADLHLLHVAPTFGDNPLKGVFEAGVDKEAFSQRLREAADEQMQKILSAQDVSGVRMKHIHLHGSAPGEIIIEYAVAENVDLLVLGTHGRRGLRRLLLGSVAQEVIHRAICPVLAVQETAAQEMPARVGRILVPIDFSVYSVNALAYAKQLAALYDATLDVLHVIDPVLDEYLQKAGWINRDRVEREVEAKAREKLVWLSNEVQGPDPTEMTQHVTMGNPPVQIVDFAKEHGADLIVMASHGLRGLNGYPVGSVTERVLRAALCPVFMTRPLGKTLLPHEARVSEGEVVEEEKRP